MAVALPTAFDTTGIHFAGAYLAVNLWALGIQGRSLWGDPLTRTAWLHYVPLAALAPCLLFAGSLLGGGLRVGIWTAVAAFQIGSALAAIAMLIAIMQAITVRSYERRTAASHPTASGSASRR